MKFTCSHVLFQSLFTEQTCFHISGFILQSSAHLIRDAFFKPKIFSVSVDFSLLFTLRQPSRQLG